MSLTPEERTLRARLAAHRLHASVSDPSAHTRRAREAFLARFEAEIDPERVLSEEERRRRAEHAKRAYFTKLSYLSARSRRTRREKGGTS